MVVLAGIKVLSSQSYYALLIGYKYNCKLIRAVALRPFSLLSLELAILVYLLSLLTARVDKVNKPLRIKVTAIGLGRLEAG